MRVMEAMIAATAGEESSRVREGEEAETNKRNKEGIDEDEDEDEEEKVMMASGEWWMVNGATTMGAWRR